MKKVCGTQLFLEDGCSRSKASFSTMAFHIRPFNLHPDFSRVPRRLDFSRVLSEIFLG